MAFTACGISTFSRYLHIHFVSVDFQSQFLFVSSFFVVSTINMEILRKATLAEEKPPKTPDMSCMTLKISTSKITLRRETM